MLNRQYVKTLKNNTNITFNVNKSDNKSLFVIKALDSDENIVASATFKLKCGYCYLNRIEIENFKYAHLGLCSQILKIIEQISIEKRCKFIEGKFCPFGELGPHAKSFYNKNGYEIYKDGYETYISKDLTKTQTTEKTL